LDEEEQAAADPLEETISLLAEPLQDEPRDAVFEDVFAI
jgi:hypothetical protein